LRKARGLREVRIADSNVQLGTHVTITGAGELTSGYSAYRYAVNRE
jgi:hypothetical protein